MLAFAQQTENTDIFKYRIEPTGGDAEMAVKGGGMVEFVAAWGENKAAILDGSDRRIWIVLMSPLMYLIGEKYPNNQKVER